MEELITVFMGKTTRINMKTNYFFLLSLLFFFTPIFTSCNDEDDITEPAGAININMMNEDFGKTELGNSDVYIDNAYNFYGPSCSITSLGKKKGLDNSNPLFNGLATKVAVEPGNAYQFFRDAAVREFPSGKLALHIKADYYNVYVLSHIIQDDVIVGANVKFALEKAPRYDLPEYDSNIGHILSTDFNTHKLTITLPSSDFEVEPAFASSKYYTLDYQKEDNKIIVKLINYKESDVFGFYIRIKESYTYVYGKII